MSKQLMDIVLPRLARPLYQHLEKYWTGEVDDGEFTRRFESLLRKQHSWLARRGVPDARAALAIHAALLVLSKSGLQAEAEESKLPLEVVEHQAIVEAAMDVERNFGVDQAKAIRVLSRVFAKYLAE